MLKKSVKETVITVIPQREFSNEDLQTALLSFAGTAINTIGLGNTIMLAECMESIIREEPDLARKLANPVIQAELLNMSKTLKGKQISFMEVMPLISKVAELLK